MYFWLSAARMSSTSSRAPCACVSGSMLSACIFISLYSLSKDLAEMTWHLRSTCHVIGVYLPPSSLGVSRSQAARVRGGATEPLPLPLYAPPPLTPCARQVAASTHLEQTSLEREVPVVEPV